MGKKEIGGRGEDFKRRTCLALLAALSCRHGARKGEGAKRHRGGVYQMVLSNYKNPFFFISIR